ncbi:hypothetical protein CKA38_08155 [Ereboglobus luteus]|uniref:Uncharacterized protein n=1 Tax=Ereboglobus luteus TaxID=1796921 RepID=A0A2U8E3C9_9BACT|nr:hypothetical protein CKA38_08155 [Ereboglobus luteus]
MPGLGNADILSAGLARDLRGAPSCGRDSLAPGRKRIIFILRNFAMLPVLSPRVFVALAKNGRHALPT